MAEKGAGGGKRERAEMMFLWALGAALLAALGLLWVRQQGWLGGTPAVVHSADGRLERPIEINTARASDLMQVRGIGERRAKDILLLRDNLIHEQKVDRKRAKEKRFGFQDVDGFLAAVRPMGFLTPEIENELRTVIRVEPLSR